MGIEDEVKARFPSERIISSCRASIKPATEQTEHQKVTRNRVFISNNGTLVATQRKLLFLIDRRNYYIAMGLLALAAFGMLVMLLLGPLGILTLVTIVLGMVVLAVLEGFIFLQMRNASVIEFDRAAVTVEKKPELQSIFLSRPGKEREIEKYEITIAEGGEFPEI